MRLAGGTMQFPVKPREHGEMTLGHDWNEKLKKAYSRWGWTLPVVSGGAACEVSVFSSGVKL